ncbi:MAG: NAD(P)/FAD-dependent oxidoreductase [Patescibacteria group bacterium]|jgi:hypothetical protein|nr:NAD(P)/FAD-dependent oxidoreductase [Patescibacteria group bacterium]
MSNPIHYNLAVIGGGPAGMLAAGRAAQLGAQVVLLEKNDRLGIKLSITGKGRCNLTNAEKNLKKFIANYGSNGKFLYSALNNFSNYDLINFFNQLGLKTKIERGQRVFPTSDASRDVIDCLKKFLADQRVKIQLNSVVKKIIIKNNTIQHIILNNNQIVQADKFILATGGQSYPQTGSNGEAYTWLKKLGHTIIKPQPALTPILIQETWVKNLAGLSLKNVNVSLWRQRKITELFGEALFTHEGLSGPVVLNLSKKIIDYTNQYNLPLNKLNLKIKIDFKPAIDYTTLDKRILRDFQSQLNKQFKNSLNQLLPQKLIPVIIDLSDIPADQPVNSITKIQRKKLIKLLKEFELNIQALAGFDKAIITTGGINLKEINPQTMQSKIIDNLYLAGEILDLDGPTGGYNLQIAWSTGYLAGQSCGLKK